jgi:pyrroloquinoline quinone biosynthesis protein B
MTTRNCIQKKGLRDSPISGVVLTNADIDHIAGLLNLRESQPLTIYATPRVHSVLASNSVYQVLNPDFVERRDLSLGETTTLSSKDGISNGLSVEPIAVPGKVALFLEDPTKENFGSVPEDTVALRITETATGNFFYYLPGCASMPSELSKLLRGAPLVFVDGTVWEDEEMITTKTGVKTGQRMGHMHLNGDDGTITAFAGLEIGRKVLIHINNTNPVLDDASPERKLTEAAGWEVGFDGMRVTL